jgi:hypothetical protein
MCNKTPKFKFVPIGSEEAENTYRVTFICDGINYESIINEITAYASLEEAEIQIKE